MKTLIREFFEGANRATCQEIAVEGEADCVVISGILRLLTSIEASQQPYGGMSHVNPVSSTHFVMLLSLRSSCLVTTGPATI